MSIQDNIARMEILTEQVKSHCMTFEFMDNKDDYTVYLPDGYRVDAIRVSKHYKGKIWALEKMLEKLEYFWKIDLTL